VANPDSKITNALTRGVIVLDDDVLVSKKSGAPVGDTGSILNVYTAPRNLLLLLLLLLLLPILGEEYIRVSFLFFQHTALELLP
jgi:hypothetical protein